MILLYFHLLVGFFPFLIFLLFYPGLFLNTLASSYKIVSRGRASGKIKYLKLLPLMVILSN
jgi:hypothetical protein